MRKYRKNSCVTLKRSSLLLLLVGMLALTGCAGGQKGGLTEFAGNGNADSGQTENKTGADETGAEAGTSGDAGTGEDGTGDSVANGENTENGENAADSEKADGTENGGTDDREPRKAIPAPDFTLVDQNGETHTMSDYKGKVVFLNFWATWCGPCQMEMPDIQDVYEEYGENAEDLVVLGVANPSTEEKPYNNDVSAEEIGEFLAEGGYTYPTVMDETGELLAWYGIQAFPTTFMIDKDGNVFGYVNGMLSREMIDSIIEQTFNAEPAVAEPDEDAGQSGAAEE